MATMKYVGSSYKPSRPCTTKIHAKSHLIKIAAVKAAVFNVPSVGKTRCSGSTTGPVSLNMVCDSGLKKSACTHCNNNRSKNSRLSRCSPNLITSMGLSSTVVIEARRVHKLAYYSAKSSAISCARSTAPFIAHRKRSSRPPLSNICRARSVVPPAEVT